MTALTVDIAIAPTKEYETFVDAHPASSLFYTGPYFRFLRQLFDHKSAECFILLAKLETTLVAVLPCVVYRGKHGNVLNSLPFYGSHGGVLSLPSCDPNTIDALLQRLDHECLKRQVVSATLIDNPLQPQQAELHRNGFNSVDQRTGQMTPLPKPVNGEAYSDLLLSMYHSKTRNMVRKALKANFVFTVDNSKPSLKELVDWHQKNMQNIGGTAKPAEVFNSLIGNLTPERDFDIFVARQQGKFAAAVLLLYSQQIVEYFTPVINDDFRSEQPLSGLIFEAMQRLGQRGFSLWNWGGTWLSQEGVYRFKSRWGADDKPYQYFSKHYSAEADIFKQAPETIVREYPYFYVKPFN